MGDKSRRFADLKTNKKIGADSMCKKIEPLFKGYNFSAESEKQPLGCSALYRHIDQKRRGRFF